MDDSDDTIRLTLGLGFQLTNSCSEPEKKKMKKKTSVLDHHQKHHDNPGVSFLSLALSKPKPEPRSDHHDKHTTAVRDKGVGVIKDLNKGKTVAMAAAAASSLTAAVSSWTTNSKTMMSDEDEDEDYCNTPPPKKRLRLSKHQISILETTFQLHPTLNPKDKSDLATQLNLRPRQVEVWFQNRRARIKMKQTEVDRESLKKCCEILKEENRRLQKEVMELKVQAAMPPFEFQLIPSSSSPTMCPSCSSNSLNPNINGNGSPTRSSLFSSSTDSNNTPKKPAL